MIESDYRALERDDARFLMRPARPYWYDAKSTPCEHVTADTNNAKLVESADGYSDSLFCLYRCVCCGKQFSTWLEG